MNLLESGRPLAGPCQRATVNRRKLNCVNCATTPATFISTDSNRAHCLTLFGCELNRTRHPSGSSLPRYSATALVAWATPEKLWCQVVSKGLRAVPMAIVTMTTPVL